MEGDEDTEMKRERVQTSTHNYAARAVVVSSRRRERSVRDPLQIIYELPSYFFPVESDAASGTACVRCFLKATYPDIFVKPMNTYVNTYALTSTPLRRRCTCHRSTYRAVSIHSQEYRIADSRNRKCVIRI